MKADLREEFDRVNKHYANGLMLIDHEKPNIELTVEEIKNRIANESNFLCYDELRALKVPKDGRAKKYRVECGITECACGCGELILDDWRFTSGHQRRKEIKIDLNIPKELITEVVKKKEIPNKIAKEKIMREEPTNASRYFTLEKRGIHTKEKRVKKEVVLQNICYNREIKKVDEIIDGFSLPSEFLGKKLRTTEPALHRVIRLWVLSESKEEANFMFFVKAKRASRPFDILMVNNGSSQIFEIEIFDGSELNVLLNVLEKRKIYKKITMVVPQKIFTVAENVEKIQKIPELCSIYGINFLISPFSANPNDFPREIYEQITFNTL